MIDYQKLIAEQEAEKERLQKAFASDPNKCSYLTQKFYTDAIRATVIHITHYERKLRLQKHVSTKG